MRFGNIRRSDDFKASTFDPPFGCIGLGKYYRLWLPSFSRPRNGNLDPGESLMIEPAPACGGNGATTMTKRSGSCLCGQVKYEVKGEPIRVGICHCANCRRESGSAFTFYAIWARDDFAASGETTLAHNGQRFCTRCSSHMFAYDEDEAEVQLGTLNDAPTKLVPTYELWVKRREPWLAPVPGAEQHWEDRHTRRTGDDSA